MKQWRWTFSQVPLYEIFSPCFFRQPSIANLEIGPKGMISELCNSRQRRYEWSEEISTSCATTDELWCLMTIVMFFVWQFKGFLVPIYFPFSWLFFNSVIRLVFSFSLQVSQIRISQLHTCVVIFSGLRKENILFLIHWYFLFVRSSCK